MHHPIRLARAAQRALLIVTLAARAAVAQAAPDLVRGRVVDDSSRAVMGATVMITRGPDRLTQQSTTDSAGTFSSRFAEGTGDYLVYVSATGFKSDRRRVQRQGTERELVVNFALARDLAVLAAMKVTADRPVRASNTVSPTQPETGGSEKWKDGVEGQISPIVAGDLGAIAGTMSNVTTTGNGPSILGSGSESNLTTLNGMGLAAGAIPRAARTETRVTGATFDATRGGFAGANIDVRLGPGSRTYQRRNGFLTLDPPGLSYSDATTRALGATSGGFKGSVGADGELVRKALTYNVALDVARSASTPSTLLSADADALLRAGVAPDSVVRVVALSAPLGVPLTGAGVPTNRERTGVSWLGRLDDTRDTMQTRALTSYVGFTRDGAIGFGPLAAPAAAGERRERTLGAQLTHGAYVGAARRVLTETRVAASGVKTELVPYRSLPAASVLVRSAAAGTPREISNLVLGGSTLSTNDDRWTIEGSNETAWNAGGRRHRFKALAWARLDGLRQEGGSNERGSYTFNSISDFAAGRASSYTRTLVQPARAGAAWNAATAIVHSWAPSKTFSMIYGARLEADGFTSSPERNAALDQALGVSSGAAPNRMHVSPRVGFSYLYSKDRENGQGTNQSPVGRFYRYQTGTIRGGIGEFRDLLRPGMLADASASTGLAGGTSVLSCVGAAVPQPDWTAFGAGSSPSQCLDGSGVLSERAPSVVLIDEGYDVPRSWRSSVDWTTNVGTMLVRLGGLASYDLSQPGTVDANFSGVQRLTLAGDGNRPVYVTSASIDPGTGSVSASESRRSSQFGRVSNRVSDLRGYGGQLTLGVSPDVFKFHGRFNVFASANYTLQESRRQYRGFDGAGFGDPREVEWAPSQNDARHVVVLSGGIGTQKFGVLTLFSRTQSGLPFTPVVQGDVNGDGRGFDRAFIPNPAVESEPGLASQLVALMNEGSSSARKCVGAYLGVVAARNGCRGPWTQSLNMQWRPPMPARWKGRVYPSVYLQNVLAGIDLALHGSESLRGWGSPATPDPVLLVPRGYDAAASRFRYDVNTRFADTRPSRTLYREPFRVVIDFSMNLSTDFDLQQLRRAVEPVKSPTGWQRRAADSLTAFYLDNTSSIHKALLLESDSLFLSPAQVTALRTADSVFSARVIAVYAPLGAFLAKGNGGAGKAELDSMQATSKAYWKTFWMQPEIADSIVTPAQKELFPMLRRMVDVPSKDRENSQWQFGSPVRLQSAPRANRPAPSGSLQVTIP